MSADFLLELLSEEIPARMQARARNDLARMFAEALALGFARFLKFLGADKMDATAIPEPMLRRQVNRVLPQNLF